MNKTMWIVVLAVAALGAAAYIFFGDRYGALAPTAMAFDPLNTTYIIDGQPVAMTNGTAQVAAAPGSATIVTTRVFGAAASGDLNGDEKMDAAVILEQDPGGSGTFYYAAAAINTVSGAQGTNAILLGDRIAPQNILIQDGRVVVNYADRNPGEPMTTPPSLGVTKYLIYQNSTLIEAPAAAH